MRKLIIKWNQNWTWKERNQEMFLRNSVKLGKTDQNKVNEKKPSLHRVDNQVQPSWKLGKKKHSNYKKKANGITTFKKKGKLGSKSIITKKTNWKRDDCWCWFRWWWAIWVTSISLLIGWRGPPMWLIAALASTGNGTSPSQRRRPLVGGGWGSKGGGGAEIDGGGAALTEESHSLLSKMHFGRPFRSKVDGLDRRFRCGREKESASELVTKCLKRIGNSASFSLTAPSRVDYRTKGQKKIKDSQRIDSSLQSRLGDLASPISKWKSNWRQRCPGYSIANQRARFPMQIRFRQRNAR